MAIENITQQPAQDLEQTIRAAMGEHPIDIIDGELTASDSFAWLEEVFKTIEQECFTSEDARRSLRRISKLAGIGEHLAANRHVYFCSRHEQMNDAFTTAESNAVAGVNHD